MPAISRFKAGFLHFGLSLSLFITIFFILIGNWYPEPFFKASGGWQGMKIVASVDVVLGPLLTLIIFNPKKNRQELKFDILVILSVQALAFLWGIYTIYNQRPIAAVFWEDSFITVNASDLTDQNYRLENLKKYSNENPALIYFDKPRSNEGLIKMLDGLQKKGISPPFQTEFYRPLSENLNKIEPYKLTIKNINNIHVNNNVDKTKTISDHDLYFYNLQSKYNNSILALNKNGNYIGYISPNTN